MNLGAFMFTDDKQKPKYLLVKQIAESRGVPCHVYTGKWRGFGEKIIMAQRASRELVQYTHLMLMDAFDVVVMASAEEILNRFLEFGHPFVCQSEYHCWPDRNKAPLFPPSPTLWRFLNSGLYVAERKYLGDLFEKHKLVDPTVYDQRWLTDVFLEDKGSIRLDIECKLFQSLHGVTQLLEVVDGKLFNKLTGTYPLVAHHHGGADINDAWVSRLWKKS